MAIYRESARVGQEDAASARSAELDQTFHVLADATRREILVALSRQGEATAGDLGTLFDSAQPTISKHLRVMEEAGLLRRRVEGRRHWFAVRPAPLRCVDRWLDRHMVMWESSLGRLENMLETRGDLDG